MKENKNNSIYDPKSAIEKEYEKDIRPLYGENKVLVDIGIDIQPNAVGIAVMHVDPTLNFCIPPFIWSFSEGVGYKQDGISEVPLSQERAIFRGQRRSNTRTKSRISNLKYHLEFDGFPFVSNKDVYYLRKKGLDEKLERGELAAVLVAMTKLRGYLSNRKCGDDKDGKVKQGISEVENKIKETNSRTLGEYLYERNNSPSRPKARGIYTSRKMHLQEYDLIIDKQQEFYPELADGNRLRDKWRRIIYHQRPLKSCKELRGNCSLLEEEVRMPKMHWKAEEFILRALLNNITVDGIDGNRKLTLSQIDMLYNYLEYREKMTIKAVRKKLGLTDAEVISLEKQKSDDIYGHHTNYILKKHMGDLWCNATDEIREIIISTFQNEYNLDKVKDELKNKIGYDGDVNIPLKSGYIKYSEKALDKILPSLREGTPEMTIVNNILKTECKVAKQEKEKITGTNELCKLDPFVKTTNHLVNRSLSNARKAFNYFISLYGDIFEIRKIRVEVCKEMKKSSKQREELHKNNKCREKIRKDIKDELSTNLNITSATKKDIIRWELAEECGWKCPYTGKVIDSNNLYNDKIFEVEHIWPKSRFNDNSFLNLTLCHTDENRNKSNRTPYEAYYGTKKWDEIMKRISKLHPEKRRKFIAKEIDKNHIPTSKLQATAYTSRVIAEGFEKAGYIVETCSGSLTSILRHGWKIGKKDRTCYLHHGEDAILIAASANISSNTINSYLYSEVPIPLPWASFAKDIKKIMSKVIVTHVPQVNSNGKLHISTVYGKTNQKDSFSVKKKLTALTKNSVKSIIDEGHKKIIIDRLVEHGIDINSKGNKIPASVWEKTLYIGKNPINKVKIKQNITKPLFFKNKVTTSCSNHHMEIFEIDNKGNKEWAGRVISNWEVKSRKLNGIPVINKEYIHKDGTIGEFVCSLVINSMIKMKDGTVCRVQKLSRPNAVTLIEHDKAVLKDENNKTFSKNFTAGSLKKAVFNANKNSNKNANKLDVINV